jgi:hypothetical protein
MAQQDEVRSLGHEVSPLGWVAVAEQTKIDGAE